MVAIAEGDPDLVIEDLDLKTDVKEETKKVGMADLVVIKINFRRCIFCDFDFLPLN